MEMNPNLQLLIEKIFDDEQTLDKITQTDDMEELYRICLTIQGGYTLQEFVDFFEKLVYICREEAEQIKKLEENELQDVSGGTDNLSRVTASALASLTFLTANNLGVYAQSIPNADGTPSGGVILRKVEPGEKEEIDKNDVELRPISGEIDEENPSVGTKIKNWLSKAADTVWDHKGAILIASVALVTGGGLLIGESKQISDNINAVRERNYYINNYKEQLYSLRRSGNFDEEHTKKMQNLEDRIKGLEEEGIGSILSKKLVVAGTVAGGLGALSGILKAGYDKFKKGIEVLQTTGSLYWSVASNRELVNMVNNRVDMVLKKTFSNFDYNDGGKRLDLLFKEFIHGQESAKKELRKFYNIFAKVLEDDKNGVATKEQLKPRILVLNGPSGTGKTYMAKLLTKCLTNIDPFFLSAGEVVKEANQFYDGNISAAFVAGGQRVGANEGGGNGTSYNNLASYLSSTEGVVRVVIVDEYDKMYVPDSEGNYPEKHPLDETFRDILDNNLNNPYTMQKIDLSKTIFICTTNETKASLSGRVKSLGGELHEQKVDEKGIVMKDEEGYPVYVKPKGDGTGTQTFVAHDPSFVQRIAGQTCYFDSLTHDDYLRIVHDALDDDPSIKNRDDLRKIGGTGRVILNNRIHYKFAGVEIDPEGYDLIADYAASMPSAARAIVGAGGNTAGSVAGNLDAEITAKCSELIGQGYSVRDMKFKAIPKEEISSTGLRVINFEIKCLGYAD